MKWRGVSCPFVVGAVLACYVSATAPTTAATVAPAVNNTSPMAGTNGTNVSATSAPTAGPEVTLPAAGPEVTTPAVTEVTSLPDDEDDCTDEFEYANNPELLERLKQYDVAKVLDEHGGAPGKVNATWRQDVPELLVEGDDLPGQAEGQQPLPDTDDKTYWLYDYGASDWDTFVRVEHALVRGKGTAREQVDVRGEVWWSPPGLCGALRHAKYRHDAGGFVAEVLVAHCSIFRKSQTISCFGPDSENECAFCISGVSGALIASLVG